MLGDSDQKVKLVVIGPTGVGKTCLIKRLHKDVFDDKSSATIGATFRAMSISKDKQGRVLALWDTAGQERYLSLAPMYVRGAHIILLVCRRTDNQAYLNLMRHYRQVAGCIPKKARLFVVETYADESDKSQKSAERLRKELSQEAKEGADESKEGADEVIEGLFSSPSFKIHPRIFSVSSVTGAGVEELKTAITEHAMSVEFERPRNSFLIIDGAAGRAPSSGRGCAC